MTKCSETCSRGANERGEIASWLVVLSALVLAAALAASSIQPALLGLVDEVAAAIGGDVSFEAPAGPSPSSPGADDDVAISGGEDGDFEPGGGSGPRTLPVVSRGTDSTSSFEDAEEALSEVQEILSRGDDDKVSEGDLDDLHAQLQGLTPEELALVFSRLSDEEIQNLFIGIDDSGFLPWTGWNDGQRAAFYDTIAPIADSPLALLRLRNALPVEDYLDFLVTVDTDHNNGLWPDGEAADDLIRQALPEEYLREAVGDGRQAEGTLAIVDDVNFRIAWEAHAAGTSRDPDRWQTLNGFVDDEGRQWVRVASANAGTPIHEAVHNYSEEALKDDVAQPLNEGVTEYFSRQVIPSLDDPTTTVDEGQQILRDRTNIYSQNTTFVDNLVAVVGEDVVAAAYFDGDIDGLRDAYIEATNRPAEDWDTMIDEINNRVPDPSDPTMTVRRPDWRGATAMLSVVPETS